MKHPYWIDYRFTAQGDVTRRWLERATLFFADLEDLQRHGCLILAFGYNTSPPPLARSSQAMVEERVP